MHQDARAWKVPQPSRFTPRARTLVDRELDAAAEGGEEAEAVSERHALRVVARAESVRAGGVGEHADRHVLPGALADAGAELVAIIAGVVAQHAGGLVHTRALCIAHGLVAVIASPIPQQAQGVVVAGALREHLCVVAIVPRVIAQDADAAAQQRAKA